jgi:hypothetical protein
MKHRSKTEVRTLPAKELRIAPMAADGFSRTLSGAAIVFGVRSQDLGGFTEIVSPVAVTNTLSGSPDILLLNNHNTSQVLSRTTSGTLKLSTDSLGVNFSCQLDTRQSYAADLAIAVERGDIRGNSFGFRTNKDSWKNENGVLTRTLEDIQIFELSVCGSPAYTQTGVSIRSCPRVLRSMLSDLHDDDQCNCDCPECQDGDCADCSNHDCDDPNCKHGDDSARSLNLWKLNMQLAIARRR